MSESVAQPPMLGQLDLNAAIHELASQATSSLLQALRHAGQARDRRHLLLSALQALDDIASVLAVNTAIIGPEQQSTYAGGQQGPSALECSP